MPLLPDGRDIIRASLEMLDRGERPLVVTIGYLTIEQHLAINAGRQKHGLPCLESREIVMLGRHLHESRILVDGYLIDDVLDQIESGLSVDAKVIITNKMTALKMQTPRPDRYGNCVRDEAVLELTARRPKAELFSVIPKGDTNSPRNQQKPDEPQTPEA